MKRQGKTSVWTFELESKCLMCKGKVIVARSEWNIQYAFHEKEWLELPEIL